MSASYHIFDILSFVATIVAVIIASWISIWAYKKEKKKEIKRNFENSFENIFTIEFLKIFDDYIELKELKNFTKIQVKEINEIKDELWIYLKRILKLIEFIRLNENSNTFKREFSHLRHKIVKNQKKVDKISEQEIDDIFINNELQWKKNLYKSFNNKKINFAYFLKYLQKLHYVTLNLMKTDYFEEHIEVVKIYRSTILELVNGVFFTTKDFLWALYEFSSKFRKVKLTELESKTKKK